MAGTSYFQLLNPMVMAIFATGFWMVYRFDRSMISARLFALAYLCGAIGFTLDFSVRDAVGPYWGQYVSNVWLLAIAVLVTAGVHVRHGETVPRMALAFGYAGIFLVVSLFLFVWPNSAARAMTMNGGTGVLLALSIPTLWRARKKPLGQLIFWLMSASVIQFFLRPALVIAYSGLDAPIGYSNSLYALTLHFTSAICAITFAASLLFSLAISLVGRLNHESQRDPLTGLLNRRGLIRGHEALCECSTFPVRPISIAVADIDHFKAINDNHGHEAGDRVIAILGNLMADHAPEGALVARIGGEEFAIVLPGFDVTSARLFAESLRTAFAATELDGLDGRRLSASFGIAGCRQGDTLAASIEAADRALYAAKAQGRDRVVAADDGPTHLRVVHAA